jgi:hypothetical protein
MQTTVEDMYLGCTTSGLPLASKILDYHRDQGFDLGRNDELEYDRLHMSQCRAESITASMLGDLNTAVYKRLDWIVQLIREIERREDMDDFRTIPIKDYEIGMTELRCTDVNSHAGFEQSQRAITAVEYLGQIEEFQWAMPYITAALMQAHCEGNLVVATDTMVTLTAGRGQQEDLE